MTNYEETISDAMKSVAVSSPEKLRERKMGALTEIRERLVYYERRCCADELLCAIARKKAGFLLRADSVGAIYNKNAAILANYGKFGTPGATRTHYIPLRRSSAKMLFGLKSCRLFHIAAYIAIILRKLLRRCYAKNCPFRTVSNRPISRILATQ